MGVRCPRILHIHEYYFRNGGDFIVPCFQCPLCFSSSSAIPKGLQPYRSEIVEDAQRFGDQRSRLNLPDDAPELPGENKEPLSIHVEQRDSLQRFWEIFGIHAFFLSGILGIAPNSPPSTVWRALRTRWGTLSDVLIALHAHHTSLTKSYLSLKPWWLGGLARGWRAQYAPRAP
jgi:hypothetical protein